MLKPAVPFANCSKHNKKMAHFSNKLAHEIRKMYCSCLRYCILTYFMAELKIYSSFLCHYSGRFQHCDPRSTQCHVNLQRKYDPAHHPSVPPVGGRFPSGSPIFSLFFLAYEMLVTKFIYSSEQSNPKYDGVSISFLI